MFKELTSIPENQREAALAGPIWEAVYQELAKYLNKDNLSFRWLDYNPVSTMIRVVSLMATLNANEHTDSKMIFQFLSDRYGRFLDRYESNCNDNNYGLILNKEPSTHFREEDFQTAIRLEGAEQVLKQTPQHFLRIYHGNRDTLFIYTNKELSNDTIYKLFELQTEIYLKNHPDANTIPNKLAKALSKKDAKKVRQIFIDFLNSDEIKKLKLQKLKNIFNFESQNRIRNYENQILCIRNEIQDLENRIATEASRIREYSEMILRLKDVNHDEEVEIICKYLDRNPYIKNYEAGYESEMTLHYEAPIIYFNETPAEKIINQPRIYTRDQIDVVKMILGRRFQLYTQCKIRFNAESFNTDIIDIGSGPELLGHPHIDRFHCFGNHREAIYESAENNDYIGALEQLSQAILNLNFYDGCVISYLLDAVLSMRDLKTWKDTETGEMLTTEEALKRRRLLENEETQA